MAVILPKARASLSFSLSELCNEPFGGADPIANRKMNKEQTRSWIISSRVWWALTITAAVLGGAPVPAAFAQQNCPEQAVPDRSTTRPYATRDDGRCEGYIVRRLSGGTLLRIVSLTATRRSFEPRLTRTARLSWKAPARPPAQVTVLAASLLPLTKYLMSRRVPAGASHYDWPLDRIVNTPLKGQHLGFLAWTELPVGGKPEQVLLPVSIESPRVEHLPVQYRLEVVPEREIDEVRMTLTRLDERARKIPVSSGRVEAGPYSPRTPFSVDISGLGQSGFYHISISAKMGTRNATVEALLYHVP